jgi:hypothetical protein
MVKRSDWLARVDRLEQGEMLNLDDYAQVPQDELEAMSEILREVLDGGGWSHALATRLRQEAPSSIGFMEVDLRRAGVGSNEER